MKGPEAQCVCVLLIHTDSFGILTCCFHPRQALAIKTADRHGCPIILANDPDADRLAVAEKQADGSWRVFNGNETGFFLSWWALHNYKRTHPHFDGMWCWYSCTAQLYMYIHIWKSIIIPWWAEPCRYTG